MVICALSFDEVATVSTSLRIIFYNCEMDKLPEYLRETVDWFMGKTRRKGDRGECSTDESEQKLYLQSPLLECRIPETDLLFLSDLPGGLDFNEWLASHTIGFFEHVNLTYGTISEYCTQSSCPEMCGPGPRNYCWIDEKGKKSRLSAPQYVDFVMTYCQKTINDETIFPTKHGNEFPASFKDVHLRKMVRLLFHVLAHVYHSHFKEIVLLQLHAHLNALFAHFVGFSVRFSLLEDKELEVMADLVDALKILPGASSNGETSSHQPSSMSEIITPPAAGNAVVMSEDNKENTLPSENLPSGGDGGSNSDVTAMEVVLTATATEASSAAPSAVHDTTHHPESMVTDSTSLNNATTATLVSASISQAADPRPSVHQSEASKATIK